MAKVEINATAQIREHKLMNEDLRNATLAVWGKNKHLLEDIKEVFFAGADTTFTRPFTYLGEYYFSQLVYWDNLGAVVLNLLDKDGKVIGSAIYGKTKFFAGLNNDNCEE